MILHTELLKLRDRLFEGKEDWMIWGSVPITASLDTNNQLVANVPEDLLKCLRESLSPSGKYAIGSHVFEFNGSYITRIT